ncbi:site-specific DNA-methyltransferase [Heyndrickxia vini]|uniref:Site-specific DNA-methyltransferase n=1 Tax=Heyndrickxia vini TaxID=1476025 RepID=A0ABX7E2U1_9BACI|nr:site-specific DNA-methyltransferase [Heyndrickxia vini]QQZ09590.1 site-specific DNA-methyltransferase [Heyndrickxia vini]
METKINKEIRSTLEKFGEKYLIEDSVNKNKVIQDLDAYDNELLGEFIENETIKENFTININGNIVLQTNKLIELFEADEYWQDSYTKYSKKIGLTVNGKFIDESTDVVLDFPYKDTVLKASMSKEDTDKDDLRPDEPFLNEVIAKEEIDVLLDKKILVNAKKYDKNGANEVSEFSDDDNLIIKGNNLLALHTLKEKYAGKVKLIYIDPPYNTGNDSFNYNDKFNHASWLTFMKNRIEVAKEILSDEGSIWVTLDDVEVHYFKVLCDEIFGRECFINTIAWRHSDNSNNNALVFSEDYNFILVYSKKSGWRPNFINDPEKRKHFKNPDNDPKGPWFDGNPVNNPGLRKNLQFNITTPSGKIIKHPANGWRWSKETMKEKFETGELRFSNDETRVIRRTYLKDMAGLPPSTLWTNLENTGHTRKAKYELKKLFPDVPVTSLFSTPKPELLIKYILEIATSENDLIMDFFMGSATTQAVAHKMGRQYIGIEQMDYINSVSIPRLQKVIEGEQGGISNEVDWQSGGSFVYVELMEKNRGFLKSIKNAESQNELRKVLNFLIEEAEIDFRIDLGKVIETLHELSLDEQKRILIKIIDKNQLYYNYSEINDKNVRDLITENDYKFNKSFYKD